MHFEKQWIFYILLGGLVILSLNNFLFWDTVHYTGRLGSFYYYNNFAFLWPPENINNGHFPLFGIYIATIWKIFGRDLLISHLAVLPFVLGIVYQTIILARQFVRAQHLNWIIALVLADATLLAQCTLVSPDIILVFFFVLVLNSLLRKRNVLFIVGAVALVLINNRGAIILIGIFLAELFLEKKNLNWKKYTVPLLTLIVFLVCHYLHFNWVGYTASNAWGESFLLASVEGLFFNLGLIIWRHLDFGRVFIVLISCYFIIKYYKSKIREHKIKYLIVITLSIGLVLWSSTILFHQLIGHRYYLPIYLLIALIGGVQMFNSKWTERRKKISTCAIIILMLLGNFWVYPDRISQGWDSSLAHLSYFKLQKEMIAYIDEAEIPFESIGSAFNNLNPLDLIDLEGRTDRMKPKDIYSDEFILYSNVWNEFTDEELNQLKDGQRWKIRKELFQYPIKVILYESIQ